MKSKREILLKSIVGTISDYRADEGLSLDAKHVDTWVNQFDSNGSLAVLSEIDHVLKKTYFSKKTVGEFLASVAGLKKLTKDDPAGFWKAARTLHIQKRGNSQTEMLSFFDEKMKSVMGFGVDKCSGKSSNFVYLDDGIFSGNHVVIDFQDWIKDEAPEKGIIHIVVIVLHTGGCYYARKRLQEIAKESGKQLEFVFWRAAEIESFSNSGGAADVLRLKELPIDKATQEYVQRTCGDKTPGLLRPEKEDNTSNVFPLKQVATPWNVIFGLQAST